MNYWCMLYMDESWKNSLNWENRVTKDHIWSYNHIIYKEYITYMITFIWNVQKKQIYRLRVDYLLPGLESEEGKKIGVTLISEEFLFGMKKMS